MPESLPSPANVPWMSRFGHLVNYPAAYYGYIYDKAFAAQLHQSLVQRRVEGGGFDPIAGEKLLRALLVPGGSRDAMELLREALRGDEPSIETLCDDIVARRDAALVR
jgi:Zn-dependent oligopeptidase